MIYVIADDLTGATDTGVKFVQKGYRTLVYIMSESIDIRYKGIDVLVIDTETRDLHEKDSRERIYTLLQALKIQNDDLVYKKIDSTLRGNIGVEIEEIMDQLNRDICIFTPSLPSNFRTTVDGSLLVNGIPLGQGEYHCNKEELIREDSAIAGLLKKQTGITVSLVDLKELHKEKYCFITRLSEYYKKGVKLIIVDSVTDEDLEQIISGSLEFNGSVLYAGSSGLAEHFPGRGSAGKMYKMGEHIKRKPFLIVEGSRKKIMATQIECFCKSMEVYQLKIDIEKIMLNREKTLKSCVSELSAPLKQKKHVVIYPDPIFTQQEFIDQLMKRMGFTLRQLELEIRDFLGLLVGRVIEEHNLEQLILVGGDTAFGICLALGISVLTVKCEVLPGIPLASGNTLSGSELSIITKAGGFGKVDTLKRLIVKLEQNK